MFFAATQSFFSDYISAAVILLQTACSSAHARGYKYMSFLLRLGRLKIFDKQWAFAAALEGPIAK